MELGGSGAPAVVVSAATTAIGSSAYCSRLWSSPLLKPVESVGESTSSTDYQTRSNGKSAQMTQSFIGPSGIGVNCEWKKTVLKLKVKLRGQL